MSRILACDAPRDCVLSFSDARRVFTLRVFLHREQTTDPGKAREWIARWKMSRSHEDWPA